MVAASSAGPATAATAAIATAATTTACLGGQIWLGHPLSFNCGNSQPFCLSPSSLPPWTALPRARGLLRQLSSPPRWSGGTALDHWKNARTDFERHKCQRPRTKPEENRKKVGWFLLWSDKQVSPTHTNKTTLTSLGPELQSSTKIQCAHIRARPCPKLTFRPPQFGPPRRTQTCRLRCWTGRPGRSHHPASGRWRHLHLCKKKGFNIFNLCINVFKKFICAFCRFSDYSKVIPKLFKSCFKALPVPLESKKGFFPHCVGAFFLLINLFLSKMLRLELLKNKNIWQSFFLA